MDCGFSNDDLLACARERMPFGRYAGCLLVDLPEPYLVWWKQQGWPAGALGRWLQCAFELRINGLEYLLDPIRETPRPGH